MKNLAAILAVLATGACAPTLAGRLVGPNGEPVTGADARVNISSLAAPEPIAATAAATETAADTDTSGAVRSVIVDVDGGGAFKTDAALVPGPYLVEALVPGFAPESRRVMLGETDGLEIQLKPSAKTVPGVISANMIGDPGRGAGGATLTPPNL